MGCNKIRRDSVSLSKKKQCCQVAQMIDPCPKKNNNNHGAVCQEQKYLRQLGDCIRFGAAAKLYDQEESGFHSPLIDKVKQVVKFSKKEPSHCEKIECRAPTVHRRLLVNNDEPKSSLQQTLFVPVSLILFSKFEKKTDCFDCEEGIHKPTKCFHRKVSESI